MDKIKERTSTKVSDGKKDFWVVFLNICLALATIVLLGYIAYKNGHIDLDNILNVQEEEEIEIENKKVEEVEEKEQVREETDTDPNGSFVLEPFEGQVVVAEVPEYWTVIEYLDGEGTQMLPTYTSFTGLTGLEILHRGKKIMEMSAAWAVGFPECPELAIFSDTSPEYVSEVKDASREFEIETTIFDYSNTEYSDFMWLGRYFRRVGNILYFDSTDETDSFDTQCETGVVSLPDLSFTNTEEEVGSVYFYYINEDATPEELEILDGILGRMLVI
jgi:hypothetical protein